MSKLEQAAKAEYPMPWSTIYFATNTDDETDANRLAFAKGANWQLQNIGARH